MNLQEPQRDASAQSEQNVLVLLDHSRAVGTGPMWCQTDPEGSVQTNCFHLRLNFLLVLSVVPILMTRFPPASYLGATRKTQQNHRSYPEMFLSLMR